MAHRPELLTVVVEDLPLPDGVGATFGHLIAATPGVADRLVEDGEVVRVDLSRFGTRQRRMLAAVLDAERDALGRGEGSTMPTTRRLRAPGMPWSASRLAVGDDVQVSVPTYTTALYALARRGLIVRRDRAARKVRPDCGKAKRLGAARRHRFGSHTGHVQLSVAGRRVAMRLRDDPTATTAELYASFRGMRIANLVESTNL